MTSKSPFKIIGVNTGNSLDAADIVLTEFGSGTQKDLAFESIPFTAGLKDNLRALRAAIETRHGDVAAAIADKCLPKPGDIIIEDYTRFVADAVKSFIAKYGPADAIGFHGQTCAHRPPSVTRKQGGEPYTVQIGDGQLLADITATTVVFDFRSDDIILGGEGAPLAPIHHQHLGEAAKKDGTYPIAFCNAGNTGNISIISWDGKHSLPAIGWDNGPFNDYPDLLCRTERNAPCDINGAWGGTGAIDIDLLRLLFEKGATTDSGENFLVLPAPKSSDPQWYRRLPELTGQSPIQGRTLSFEDRLRTAEYFAAYVFVFGLSWVPKNYVLPRHFALCGGGWNNAVITRHFKELLNGSFSSSPVLPEHRSTFDAILHRLGGAPAVKPSLEYGFDGQAMEARIFADAAMSRLLGEPFSMPTTTGVSRPALLGLIRYPARDPSSATEGVKELLNKTTPIPLPPESNSFDRRWSRAAPGWKATLGKP